MATTYLSRTTVTPTNATKFTFSAWCKIADVTGRKCVLGYNGGNHWYVIQFDNSADNCRFEWVEYNSGGTKVVEKYTSASLRDVNGYYHIVCKYDSTQGTVADRTKLYINGEVATLATNNNPSHMLSAPSALGGHTQLLGAYANGDNHFNGIISHAHYCDGYAYDASAFGSTDSTTGEWKINTSPSVTYGNNGFFVLKNGNSVTDQSPNTNNFTVAGGTLTKTEDCPSNVFATANSLVRNSTTLSYGNTRIASGTSNWYGIPATLGVETGKFYWEYKLTTGNAWSQVGVMSSKPSGGYNSIVSTYVGNNSGGIALNSGNGDIYQDGSSGTTWFSGGLAVGDIIGVALDATNNKIYFAKNGSWGNSSNPANGTNGQTLDSNFTNYKPYLPAFSVHNCIIDVNFGNGYFGGTAISSAGTNASGIGIFEYDVPTGFTALSTKGLNE